MEQRKGNKIIKWDEVSGATTEIVDTASYEATDLRAIPIRTLEDMIEQNDNMLDGIINNLPEETVAEKEERTSVVSKLKTMEPRIEKKSKGIVPELVIE